MLKSSRADPPRVPIGAPTKEKIVSIFQIILQVMNMGIVVMVYGVSSQGDKYFLIISFGSLITLLACMPIERLVPNARMISDTSKAPVALYLFFLFLVSNLIILMFFLAAVLYVLIIPENGRLSFSYTDVFTTVIYGMALTNLMIRGGILQYQNKFFVATKTFIVSPLCILLFLVIDLITAGLGPAGVLFCSSLVSLVIAFCYPKPPVYPVALVQLKYHYLVFIKTVVSSSYLKLSHAIYHFSITWFITSLGLAAAEGSILLLNISKRAAEAVTQVAVAPSTRRLLVYVSNLSHPRSEISELALRFYGATIKYFVLLGIIAAVTLGGYIHLRDGTDNAQLVVLYFIPFVLCQILILLETPFSTINNVNNKIWIFLFANLLFALSLMLLGLNVQSVTISLFGTLVSQAIVLLIHYLFAVRTNR
jgi:hypothetical protein